MGTYGTKNGIVIWRDVLGVARIATLKAGEIQAALINDGFTWAGGKGRADANGIVIRAASSVSGDRAYAFEETNGADIAWYSAYSSFTFGGDESGLASHLVLRARGIDGVTAGAHARNQIEAHSTTGAVHVLLKPYNTAATLLIDFWVTAAGLKKSDFGGVVLSNIGNAVLDTDALALGQANLLYAPIGSVLLLASQAETEAGTITTKAVPPAYLALRKIGSGWALGTGGNNRGSGAIDLQGGRGANSQVASGSRATVAGGYSNTASGVHATVGGGASNMATHESAVVAGGAANAATGSFAAVLGGGDNIAAEDNSVVAGGYDNVAAGDSAAVLGGRQAAAGLYGQQAHAGGQFASRGDAQRSDYVLRNATTDATQTEIFLDGAAERLALADDTTWFFEARIAARRTDANGESAAYKLEGCIDRNAGTVALVGAVLKTTLAEDTAAWDVTAVADDTNKALAIKVTGEAGKTIRWVCHVSTVEVTG